MIHQLRFLALAVFLTFNFACSAPVAQVDELAISKKDVDYNSRVIKLYYPEYSGDIQGASLQQLIQSATNRKILENNGRPIGDKDLQAEAERIDRTTLLPEKVKAIKDIFGSDRDAYLRVFVAKTLVDRVIYYEFFLHDPKIQAESLNRAQQFLNEALSSGEKASKPEGIHTARFKVSLENGIEPEAPKEGRGARPEQAPQASAPMELKQTIANRQKQQVSAEAERWINEILSKLKPGQYHSSVIDQNESWWVVRYLKPKAGAKDTYEIEATVFPKANYATWLEKEKAKIHVKGGESK